MSVLDDPARGSHKATIDGRELTFRLTMGAIERWEDKHPKGIYALLRDAHADGPVTLGELKDILAVALVGAGMDESEASGIVDSWSVQALIPIQVAAVRTLMACFQPEDLAEGDPDGEVPKA